MQISVLAAPNSHFSFQVSELHKHRNLILRHKPDPTQLQHRSVISRFLFLPLLSSLEEKCKHKKYTMQAASHKNNSNNRSGEYAHWVQSCVILPFFFVINGSPFCSYIIHVSQEAFQESNSYCRLKVSKRPFTLCPTSSLFITRYSIITHTQRF